MCACAGCACPACGAGFWLAAVTAATLGPAHGQHPMEHPMAAMNTAETGFINSQPSMAEFMTALPHMGGDLQGPGSLSPQPPGGYPPMDGHGVNVPEYPWMKEKKTTRKSSQQGTGPRCSPSGPSLTWARAEDMHCMECLLNVV